MVTITAMPVGNFYADRFSKEEFIRKRKAIAWTIKIPGGLTLRNSGLS